VVLERVDCGGAGGERCEGADAGADFHRRPDRDARGAVRVSKHRQNRAIQEREATLLLQKFRFASAAILVENNDFGLSFRDNMRRTFEQAGVRIVLDIPQDRQDANWYSTITRIKGAAPDIVVMSMSAGLSGAASRLQGSPRLQQAYLGTLNQDVTDVDRR
jgi:hypothetical protein